MQPIVRVDGNRDARYSPSPGEPVDGYGGRLWLGQSGKAQKERQQQLRQGSGDRLQAHVLPREVEASPLRIRFFFPIANPFESRRLHFSRVQDATHLLSFVYFNHAAHLTEV